MSSVLQFPGGAVAVDAFRDDEAPTKTTRLCDCGKQLDERGNCQWCEAQACREETGRIATLREANRRSATELQLIQDLAESESLLLHALHRSRSGFWRQHVSAAREAVTRALNELKDAGFEDSPPCEVPR